MKKNNFKVLWLCGFFICGMILGSFLAIVSVFNYNNQQTQKAIVMDIDYKNKTLTCGNIILEENQTYFMLPLKNETIIYTHNNFIGVCK